MQHDGRTTRAVPTGAHRIPAPTSRPQPLDDRSATVHRPDLCITGGRTARTSATPLPAQTPTTVAPSVHRLHSPVTSPPVVVPLHPARNRPDDSRLHLPCAPPFSTHPTTPDSAPPGGTPHGGAPPESTHPHRDAATPANAGPMQNPRHHRPPHSVSPHHPHTRCREHLHSTTRSAHTPHPHTPTATPTPQTPLKLPPFRSLPLVARVGGL